MRLQKEGSSISLVVNNENYNLLNNIEKQVPIIKDKEQIDVYKPNNCFLQGEEKEIELLSLITNLINNDNSINNANSLFYDNNNFIEGQLLLTTQNTDKIKKEKQIPFYIQKIKVKYNKGNKGRRRKKTFYLNKVKHGKYSKDNIIQKIIRKLINNSLKYINQKYNEYKKNLKSKPFLRKITTKHYKVFSNDKIQNLFDLKLEDLFSSELSTKYSKFMRNNSKDYNKIQIDSLKEKGEPNEIIIILNLTLYKMLEKYINEGINEFNLDNDLISIEKEHGIEYKILYRKIAKELFHSLNKNEK